jgi:tetratricopeptide (TPR) repeat protein
MNRLENVEQFESGVEHRVPLDTDALILGEQASRMAISGNMRLAQEKLAVGDSEAAHFHWKIVRAVDQAPIEAWLLPASHPSCDIAQRIQLLEDAIQRFPRNSSPYHDLARAEERRGGWCQAETHWRAFISIDPNKWWAFVSLSNCLTKQGKNDDARTVLDAAKGHFPAEVRVFAELARLEQSLGCWARALEIWEEIIQHFPASWIGYRGKIATLSAQGKPQEANLIHLANIDSFPHDLDALHDAARFSERNREWPKAVAHWRAFTQLERNMPWAYQSLAAALREDGQFEEADAILTEAIPRFPSEASLLVEWATCSERRADWQESARRWQALSLQFPNQPTGSLGLANSLRRQRKFDEADVTILSAIENFSDCAALYESFGLTAMAKEDWTQAMQRFQQAEARFPKNNSFRPYIFDIGIRSADVDGKAISASVADVPKKDATEARSLVMQFESLGGGGHGCEFGIFQRHFGAEPLGLLRWADIFQEQLATALETDFSGVGEPEYTKLFIPPNSARPEYWTTDTRYHMAMRCFVHVDEVPLEIMTRRVTKRLTFLKNKLMEDLKAASKIFVYKNMKRNLTPEEVQRLYKACRRHGPITLLYIQYSDYENSNGVVRELAPGLLVGYIDHFSHSPTTDEYLGSANNSLMVLCRRAYVMWSFNFETAIDEDVPVLQAYANHLYKTRTLNDGESFLSRLRLRFLNSPILNSSLDA